MTGSEYYVSPTPPVISGSIHFADDTGDTARLIKIEKTDV